MRGCDGDLTRRDRFKGRDFRGMVRLENGRRARKMEERETNDRKAGKLRGKGNKGE